ncbi:MAG: uracil-DNA glycosylase [Bacteroidetes bacterium]|nr:MAG: uracil-DNA glycosylase [Bacteroidota bacterium]
MKLSDCKICEQLGKDHVPPTGPMTAELMIIGQSPGRTEVKEGKPFVGPCGEYIDYLLDELLLDRSDVYITNTLKCHPPKNRPGKPEEIRNCKKTWLRHELRAIKPKVILLLGRDAYEAVMPRNLKTKYPFSHGLVVRKKHQAIVVSYHPSYFLRQGNLLGFLEIAIPLSQLLEGGEHGSQEA